CARKWSGYGLDLW
nr:immunoglobulin heavy chain junction region [Macaca mulatta]MOX41026.1 immunoglobulin heavy chain junction region [Macaca mulatta]